MDLRKLKTLIDLVSESNISELEITETEGKVRIVKGGGAAPVVLNAANEVAVASFLAGEIRFPDIVRLVQDALNQASYDKPYSISDVLEIDRVTRAATRAMTKASCS